MPLSGAFAQAIKYEVERSVGVALRVAIGAPTEAIDGVQDSYLSAQSVLKGMATNAAGTRIMDAADRGMQVGARLMSMDVVPVFEKLRCATSQETEEILRQHFDAIGTVARQSVIMANYLYVDILLAAMRVIRENGGDPEKIIPEAVQQQTEGVRAFSGQGDMVDSARKILFKAIRFRDSQNQSHSASVARAACAYIDRNYVTPDMTLSDVAKHVALSNNHFCTVFSQEMGVTFIEYLTALRMKKAKELLKLTDMRSSDVAAAIGYSDPHYFSYLFKKNVGMNPRDYRNSCRR
jgi:two-component system response regulator YesN